jgi:monoamine oxidase
LWRISEVGAMEGAQGACTFPPGTLSTLTLRTPTTLSTSRNCDIAIVGGGVAGLAAMRALEERGLRTCVVEARNRIGGRIHTVRDPRLPHPIELGAEFVHGSAPELLNIVHDARLLAYTVEGDRWRARGGRLTRLDDFWKRLHSVMRHLDADRTDRTFAEFLEGAPGGRSAADARSLALAFVEGFHAADARRISAKALADGGSPSEDRDEQRQMRIVDGYDRVPEWLASGFGHRIMTNAVVERIDWADGGVELSVRQGNAQSTILIAARATIITVPLGVLLAPPGEPGAITFSPQLPILDRVRVRLTMGSVVRVIVLFRERWWTKRLRAVPRGASLESMSFLHGDSGDVPVWWSLHPVHAPVMVGWAGGPVAERLSGRASSEIHDRALAALAANLGVTRRRVAAQVEECWTHDWQHDPFSRGAYSYALVGGADAPRHLARPITLTLWFAGEAADPEGRTGTVHGAMGSGRRAALSVTQALARGRRRS